MARIISSIATKPRNPMEEARVKAAKRFKAGQDVRAGGREGKVKRINLTQGILTIAFGKRTRDYAADFVEKIG